MNATPFHRLGLTLTLSAIKSEADSLQRELHPFEDDDTHILSSDVTLKCNLEEIQKHANRISHLCGAEITKLVERLNRHATIATK